MRREGYKVIVIALTAGCTSYKADLEAACAAPDRVELSSSDTPADRNKKLGTYLEQHVKTAKGVHFVQAISAPMAPRVRSAILRNEATTVGLPNCKLADAWEAGTY